MTEWQVHGKSMGNCNCAYGCPCQFNALPTDGTCEAAATYQIESGHYGKVDLSGLNVAAVYQWPGPVHEGNGVMQLVIDASASAEQKSALVKIMSGEDTDEMATMWWIYNAMCPTKLPVLDKKISVAIDIDNRVGEVSIPGVFDTTAVPIRNPITGEAHRARIDLPNGFEYELAEMASGTTKTYGDIKLDLKDSFAMFNEMHLSNHGLIRDRKAA